MSSQTVFSVMSGYFLSLTSTKQRIKCLKDKEALFNVAYWKQTA